MLDNNPWVCSCENAWIGSWIKRWHSESMAAAATTSASSAHLHHRHHRSASPSSLTSVACRDPISSKKRPMVDLPTSDNAACTTSGGASASFRLGNRRNVDALVAASFLLTAIFKQLANAHFN